MLKELTKKITKGLGYEIQGGVRAYAAERTMTEMFRQEQVNLILDVGANCGQFAEGLWASGYAGRLISFEPLAVPHAKMRAKAGAYPNWTIADRTAVGSEVGTVNIHVSENSVSSSILPMLPSHLAAAPQSGYTTTETVPVSRLDDLCSFTPADRVGLKIDVQGFERQVIDGAPRVLKACRALVIEMCLVPLYEDQLLAKDL